MKNSFAELFARRKPSATTTANDPAASIPFDVVYYREAYPDLHNLADRQLRAHWLSNGYAEGRYASAQHEYAARTGEPLPTIDGLDKTAIDAEFYAALYPDLAKHGVVAPEKLLQHYLRYGQEEGRIGDFDCWLEAHHLPLKLNNRKFTLAGALLRSSEQGLEITAANILEVFLGQSDIPVPLTDNSADTATLYIEIARHYLMQQQRHSARKLLHVALHFSQCGEIFELLANTYYDEGHYGLALQYFENCIARQQASRWCRYNLANCLAKLNRYEEAIEALLVGIKTNPDFTQQIDLLDSIVNQCWDYNYAIMLNQVDCNDRETLIQSTYSLANFFYHAYLTVCGRDKNPEHLKTLNTRRILIVGDYHVPQCERYRINQKIEQLESIGRDVKAINWESLDANASELSVYDVIIFYRVPAVPKVLKAMAQTNAAGKLSLYEIDDLLFDPIYPPSVNSYGGYLGVEGIRELTRGMALFSVAARFCRVGIASTEPLRQRLARLVFGGQCLLHRNGLDSLNSFRVTPKGQKKTLDIFYGSGTLAHNQDFIELALPALEKLLTAHSHVRLVIVGYLRLPGDFVERFGAQLQQLPAVKSVQAYWSLLEQADINVAVLHDDEINACKSELKWFEAACFGIPSVVSDTQNYRDVIHHGEDAFIARTPAEWEEALTALVTNPVIRQRVGNAAMLRVKSEYSLETLGAALAEQIDHLNPAVIGKKKLALVNVFFPPQSIGGATRVVADNFSSLRVDHGDEFELCVFTADSEQRHPHQITVYNYHDVPVYRVTTLFRENMDWHPQDPVMYELFQEFLACEKPDLIHFHCVQRLSASIVEAARDNEIPYVITAHDAWWISDFQFLVGHNGKVYPQGHPDPYETLVLPPSISREQSIERKIYLRSLLEDAGRVLTVSHAFADIYRKNGILDVEVTPNGISDDVEWAPKNTAYTPRVVGGHIGGMAEHKGYFLLKSAVLALQPENMEFLVVDHSKESGYESREVWGAVPVTVVGRVSQDQIVELYRKIDVLFAPSTWPESFGLVTREAAACGCWIVASNMGGIGEDVIEGKNGYVIPPQLTAMTSILSAIDKNSEQYKHNTQVETRFMASEQVGQLVGIYND